MSLCRAGGSISSSLPLFLGAGFSSDSRLTLKQFALQQFDVSSEATIAHGQTIQPAQNV